MILLESGLHWATALLIPLLLIISLQVMGFFSRGNKFQVEGRTVLLTGGSYGMGKELAKQLSQRGAHLILVARDAAKLQTALAYAQAAAKSPTTQRFHFISADVSSRSENARVLAEATAWNAGSPPEIVWANAGSSTPGLFVETDMEIMRRQMDLNFWAAAYLAQDTLKAWLYPSTPYKPLPKGAKAEAPRHFIITSSAVAYCNIAGYAAYGPAKTALRALADTLRQEVLMYNGARRSSKTTNQVPAPFDINVQIVCPGNISTPGHVEEDKTKHAVTVLLEETDPIQSELEAALAVLKGLDNGNYMTATNWLVELARISTIGNSPKNNIVTDTIGQLITAIAWLFIGPDMDGKAWGLGKKEGFPEFKPLVDPRAKQV